jgi:hypothetical protein
VRAQTDRLRQTSRTVVGTFAEPELGSGAWFRSLAGRREDGASCSMLGPLPATCILSELGGDFTISFDKMHFFWRPEPRGSSPGNLTAGMAGRGATVILTFFGATSNGRAARLAFFGVDPKKVSLFSAPKKPKKCAETGQTAVRLSASSRMSVTNMQPGLCVIANGSLADCSTACGVTPQAQKTGSSSSRMGTGSP